METINPVCLSAICTDWLSSPEDTVHRVVLLAPLWRSQPWFPVLFESLMDYLILLPQNQTLLTNPKEEFHPLISQNSLQLVAWKVLGKIEAVNMFQKRLLTSAQHGEKEQKRVTQQPGIIGQVGVVDGKLIPLFRF